MAGSAAGGDQNRTDAAANQRRTAADADSAEEKRINRRSYLPSPPTLQGWRNRPGRCREWACIVLAGAVRKIENLHKAGDTESLRRVFAQIRQVQRHEQGRFSEAAFCLEVRAEPVNAEVADEVQEESAPAIPEG